MNFVDLNIQDKKYILTVMEILAFLFFNILKSTEEGDGNNLHD